MVIQFTFLKSNPEDVCFRPQILQSERLVFFYLRPIRLKVCRILALSVPGLGFIILNPKPLIIVFVLLRSRECSERV